MSLDPYLQSTASVLRDVAPWVAAAARWISLLGSPAVLWIVTCIIVIAYVVKREVRLATVWLTAMLAASAIVTALKAFFSRTRPGDGLLQLVDPSFPSGHALVSAAFFTILWYFWSRRARFHSQGIWAPILVCIIVPLLVGISRVALGVHWATDVVAGWVIGVVVAALAIALTRR